MKYHLSLNLFSVKANSRSYNLYGCPELWLAPFHHGWECSLTWAKTGTLSPWSEMLTDLGCLAPFHHSQKRSLTWVMAGTLSPWLGRSLTWVMAGTLSYLFSVKHCEMRSAAFSSVVSSGSSFGGSILSHGTVS